MPLKKRDPCLKAIKKAVDAAIKKQLKAKPKMTRMPRHPENTFGAIPTRHTATFRPAPMVTFGPIPTRHAPVAFRPAPAVKHSTPKRAISKPIVGFERRMQLPSAPPLTPPSSRRLSVVPPSHRPSAVRPNSRRTSLIASPAQHVAASMGISEAHLASRAPMFTPASPQSDQSPRSYRNILPSPAQNTRRSTGISLAHLAGRPSLYTSSPVSSRRSSASVQMPSRLGSRRSSFELVNGRLSNTSSGFEFRLPDMVNRRRRRTVTFADTPTPRRKMQRR